MAKANTKDDLTCMSCGTPIKSGFFCEKCVKGENDKAKPSDGWVGTRFTGEAKKRRQRQMMMDELATWGKRLLIVAVIGGLGYGGWTMFGSRIKATISEAKSVTDQKPKYDPTKDAAANEDDQAQSGNGKRAFTPAEKSTTAEKYLHPGGKSIDGGD